MFLYDSLDVEPTSNILLNENSIKLTPKDLLLCIMHFSTLNSGVYICDRW